MSGVRTSLMPRAARHALVHGLRGAAVVAYTFAVPGWTHDLKRAAGADGIPLYRYPAPPPSGPGASI